MVQNLPRVNICERGERGTDPGVGNGFLSRLACAVVAIIDECLVFMGVAKEHSGNHVGRVSLDDLIEIIRPTWRGICSVPWSIVSKDFRFYLWEEWC